MLNILKIALAGSISTFLLTSALLTPATAQEADFPDGIRFELGVGASIKPTYEGSSDYEISPTGTGGLSYFKFRGLHIGGGDDLGFSLGPSFRFIGEREASDDISLAGIPNIDASLELGLKASYEWEAAKIFASARYGVIGHNAITGELGADAIWRISPDTKFSIGPRVSYASEEYFDTYFSVPVTATNLAPFDASGGFKSAGVNATVRHDFNDRWAVKASGEWNRLIGDAASSPIVKAGSEDQFTAKLFLIRKFDILF